MMEPIVLTYDVDGDDFSMAGEASSAVKKHLKQLGFPPDLIRRVAIAMYEGEINMVIHANGGKATVEITQNGVRIILADHGPGIPDVALAMQEGYSTAPEEVRNLGFGAGMGLPNIQKYSDDLKIDTQAGVGTTLTIQIHT
ncbi:MAG: anti-sigma regulatory factor [Clostridiales bacterium]|nr:MAG: anti-sigma regulatory factor [Clostridiales bacterium]